MRYRANPVEVEAFKISRVGPLIAGCSRELVLEDGKLVVATAGMMSRMTPKPGDYVVTQLVDGYVYLNPREVFERKYTPIVGA